MLFLFVSVVGIRVGVDYAGWSVDCDPPSLIITRFSSLEIWVLPTSVVDCVRRTFGRWLCFGPTIFQPSRPRSSVCVVLALWLCFALHFQPFRPRSSVSCGCVLPYSFSLFGLAPPFLVVGFRPTVSAFSALRLHFLFSYGFSFEAF